MCAQGEFHQLPELFDVQFHELLGKSFVFQDLTLRSQKHLEQLPIVDILEKGYDLALGRCQGERMLHRGKLALRPLLVIFRHH